ncbi:hypothetical protein D3C86_1201330 [compost metagenome]
MKFSKLKIVNIAGWLQIIGGVVGLGLIAYLLLQTEIINGALLLIFLTGIGLFLFSIYAGKLLCFDEVKNKGLVLTFINQLLQLLQWNVMGYGISYSAGPAVIIGVKEFAITFNAGLFSNFSMSIRSDSPSFISINLIPLVIIIFLAVFWKKQSIP